MSGSSPSGTLYLIDGHAQMFRAYHAIRTPMSSPVTKEPTNATFGFIGMLLKVLREHRPEYLAMVIDASGDRGTFRSQMYPEYKMNREAPPEALSPQVERCVALTRAIGVPVLGVEEVEADDTIATVVERLKREAPGLKIRIVSKDKDLMQLLEAGRVEMVDVHTDEVTDEAKLREEKGIGPGQVVDMLALMGDTVDNVPGVEGIGPKTAAQLIGEYGTLEALLARAGEIKGKRGEKLREAAGRLPLSRALVELKRDVEVPFEVGGASTAELRLEALGPILKELGFNRYQEDVQALIRSRGGMVEEGDAEEKGAAKGGGRGAKSSGGMAGLFDEGLFSSTSGEKVERAADGASYECVRTEGELRALVERCRAAEVVSIDTETTGLAPLTARLCGVSISVRAGEGFYVPVRSPEEGAHLDEAGALEILRPMLEDARVPKCGHNLKYDLLILRRAGVELRGIAIDSMVASYLIDSARSSHSLDALALGLLGRTNISITELIGSGKQQRTFDTVDLARATPYAAEDADVALQLCALMWPQIRAMGLEKLMREVETPLIEVLGELEWNGIRVDGAELERQRARLEERIGGLRREIVDASPRAFNPDSPKQLAGILFNKPTDEEAGLGIKPVKKTKTGFSTDVEVLERLAEDAAVTSPVPGLVVEYRQLTKLVGTYLVALNEAINPETGRIHASFHQTVAATGRLSSSDPNLQNIPIRSEIGREIRKAFVAAPGNVLISADYSQIELRMLAHLSRDPGLIRAFEEGQDIHRAVAAQIHGVKQEEVTREQRDGAKMVNFGIVYGITSYGLARRLGVGEREAAEIIEGYKKRFAGITTFLQECVEQAERFGFVETILGRRRSVPQAGSRNAGERSFGERIAINSVVQGSAADLIKVAMVDLHRRLSPHAAERASEKAEVEGVRMLVQIHDELLFEAEEGVAEEAKGVIVERMEKAMSLRVPLVAEAGIGKDWFGVK